MSESAELAYLRPRVSELEHLLAQARIHIARLENEVDRYRRCSHVSQSVPDFEPTQVLSHIAIGIEPHATRA